MNDTHSTAAATSEALSVPETGLALLPDVMTPEAFEARIKLDRQMRKILTDYVKDELKEGHHFYTQLGNQQLEKPALKKEGAYNIASLFKLTFGSPDQKEKYFDDGHYQCDTTIDIFNGRGERIATGIGICTTRESKYRWRKESRTCPECGMPSIFKDNKTQNGGWYCWAKRDGCGAKFQKGDERIEGQQIGRVENPDLADSYNTVRKMSLKRAQTGGICQVPLVSEIFAPANDDDDDAEPTPARQQQQAPRAQPQQAAPPQNNKPNSDSFVLRATSFAKKLIDDHGVEVDALTMQFLPEGVARFEDLTEDQAKEIMPGLSELLNSKVSGK